MQKRLTKKYRPVGTAEVVGNKTEVEELWSNIESRTPTLLYGPTGTGKTSSVYLVANKLDRDVIELNASDKRRKKEMKKLVKQFSSKSLNRTFGEEEDPIFLLDEVDGMGKKSQGRLIPMLKKAYHPVVLTANEKWKLIDDIPEECATIEFKKPKSGEILERLKLISDVEEIDADFSKISRDVRASINAAFYGGDKYKSVNIFNKLRDLFMGRDVDEIRDDEIMTWVLDNAPRFYRGKKLYNFYRFLCKVDMIGDLSLLNEMEKGHRGEVRYPRFFRRLKSIKREKKKSRE